MREKVQKALSRAGICSRRTGEEYIKAGRVSVDGIVCLLGDTCDLEQEELCFDGAPVKIPEELVYIMLNKPRGYVTTMSDESGRKIVTELLNGIDVRVHPVGRLDMYSEGLLILTSDGQLTNKLTHPSHNIYKEYNLVINATPQADPVGALSRNMEIDGYTIAKPVVKIIKKLDTGFELSVKIKEGRNRQIRKMCDVCGFTVARLMRVAVGELELGDLKTGKYRHLSAGEVEYLKNCK